MLHLVSPTSLESWFAHFVTMRSEDKVQWLGEQAALTGEAIRGACHCHAEADITVLHSSHDTLLRDIALAEHLEQMGCGPLIRQTTKAALLGTDKVAMKCAFEEHSVLSIAWRQHADGISALQFGAQHDGPFVVKLRNGTEGRALRLSAAPSAQLDEQEFEEPFIGGTEYSVVVLRSGARYVTLPTVWKGPTRRDLLPPYQRLRLCPAPDLTDDRNDELRQLSLAACEALDSEGFAEVELIVDGAGQARVIEVNPRIAGTMRMAALACDQRIFDLPVTTTVHGHLGAQRCVVEMPYHGNPWSAPERLVYCTSRLTVAAGSWSQLPAHVDAALGDSVAVAHEWRRSLELALSELCATR